MSNQILLVDDDIDLLDAFAVGLKIAGHSVITASTPKEGLELYRNNCPCIVLSDIKMPEMDGYELFSEIRKLDQSAKVVLITGHEDKEKTIFAKNNGLIGIVNKPVTTKKLDAIIKENNC